MDLQPGEERLMSYAMDLGTEVKVSDPVGTERLTAIRIAKGVVHTTHKLREAKVYQVKSRSPHDRTLILEHPFRDGWALVAPKAGERSRDVYRFEVQVPAGQALRHEVVEEQVRSYEQELVRTGDDFIRLFLRSDVPSPKLKEVLRKAVEYKQGIAGIRQELTRLQGQLKAIADDQARLRANIDKVPKDSAAYKRYLAKFDQQETQIEKLQAQVEEKQEAEKARQKEYDGYLATLTVE
jgi:hypothetical protein